jgi:hypothetical protein
MKKKPSVAVSDRPSPCNCLRTRTVSGPCDVCGGRPEVIHIPMQGTGFRCAEHCDNRAGTREPGGGGA